jgi:hypothetical protein
VWRSAPALFASSKEKAKKEHAHQNSGISVGAGLAPPSGAVEGEASLAPATAKKWRKRKRGSFDVFETASP